MSEPKDEYDDDGEDPQSSHDDPRDAMPKAVRQRLEALIPEMVKKTFAAGMGAVFSTEEGIRRLTRDIGDLSLPKEVAGYLANTAGATKDEIIRIIAREVREFLQTINLSDEIAKLLTTLSFEVKTEIRFIPNDEKYGAVKPDVKAQVRLKRAEEPRRGRRRRRRRREREGEEPEGMQPESREPGSEGEGEEYE